MRTIALTSIFWIAVISSCSRDQDLQAFPMAVIVHDEFEAGVAGAQITIGEQVIGETGSDGLARHTVRATEGQRISIWVVCPEGTLNSGPHKRTIQLRSLRKIDKQGDPFAQLRARFRCEHRNRSHVVVLRTNLKESFPVQLLGETVGHTGNNGIYQLVVDGPVGEELEVRIDTSSDPKLRPASPSRAFRIPAVSRLLVFDQSFEKKQELTQRTSRGNRIPRRL